MGYMQRMTVNARSRKPRQTSFGYYNIELQYVHILAVT